VREILTFCLATVLVMGRATAQTPAVSPDYLVWVASEATDRIALIRFNAATGAKVDREFTIGLLPTDPDGPHGLSVSPDRRFLYITTAHGQPFGFLWKIDATTNAVVGRVELGMFPATLQLTPDGAFAYVVNFNVHGDMVPSSVSIVGTDDMLEIARVPTCTMPHGSRLNPQGTKQYSACMMDDMVVEIDTRTFGVARAFSVAKGAEQVATLPEAHHSPLPTPHAPSCSPTWAQPSADGSRVYVACNKSNEILEIVVNTWALARRFPAADGVYNLAVTPPPTGCTTWPSRTTGSCSWRRTSGGSRCRSSSWRRVRSWPASPRSGASSMASSYLPTIGTRSSLWKGSDRSPER